MTVKFQTSQHDESTIKRDTKGLFAKGHSGNPSGRARMPKAVKDMLSENAERAVQAIVRLVDDTDPRIALRAAELLLDRIFGKPQQASETVTFAVPKELDGVAGLLALHQSLIIATASGQIAMAEAKELSGLIEGHRRIVETTELEQRIAKLEQEANEQP